jgi:hypothetical protein
MVGQVLRTSRAFNPEKKTSMKNKKVLFFCKHNAYRSQMADERSSLGSGKGSAGSS